MHVDVLPTHPPTATQIAAVRFTVQAAAPGAPGRQQVTKPVLPHDDLETPRRAR